MNKDMSRQPIYLLVFLVLALIKCSSAEETAQRPNVLFILTDDQAYWGIGYSGNEQLSTPTIDRLASEGARFTNFFVPTPVCSPARASLMTSKYGSEVGITDWINHHWDGTLRGPEPDLGLDPQYVTWAELLQLSGYQTALIGKWHLGINQEYHPTNQGFDYFMGFLKGGVQVENPTLEVNGRDSIITGLTTDILTEEALSYLRSVERDKPFLLSLNYRAPHAPWWPLRAEDYDQYKDLNVKFPHPDYPNLDEAEVTRRTREYYGAIASLDRSLQQILNTLESENLDQNTIVIFTSDHGYNIGHNGIWHKGNGHWILTKNPPPSENIPSGQRPNMFDNSLRVPTLVKWPGVTTPGTEITNTATILDWYPTLLDITGCDLPDSLSLRGRNLTPLLKGEPPAQWNQNLYAEYSTHHQSRTHMRVFRTPRWKLILDFLNPDRHELFDLKNDPEETNNVYHQAENHEIVQVLHGNIIEKMTEIKDPLLNYVNTDLAR